MRRLVLTFALGLGSLLGVGCGEGASPNSGVEEPIRVRNAQFVEGTIPDEGGTIDVLPVGTQNTYVPRGLAGKKLLGHAELGGNSVAITLKDQSSGYWVLPMGPEDLNQAGASMFEPVVDFSPELPPGEYTMLFSATDAQGRFGKPFEQLFNIREDKPQGSVVATLDWDSKADLDIHIISPSGKELDPKHPNTVELGEDGLPVPDAVGGGLSGNGQLDRDSNGACVQDGYKRENVVWDKENPPEAGTYLVQAHMWSACGTPAASFVFSLTVDGAEVMNVPGRLLEIDADGGAKTPGLFVGYFTCDAKGNCS